MSNNSDAIAAPGHRGRMVALISVVVAGGLAAFGIWSRSDTVASLKQEADDTAIPRVQVVSPKLGPPHSTLTLPGNIDAWYEAPIYAQVSGYLQSWTADIGTQVKAGQLLATISTPNLDQQLAQAQANLVSAMSNEQIAATTAARWNKMRVGDAVSQQDADQKNADYAAAHAATSAAQAAVNGFQAQEGFKRIVAPFDGIVTQRNTDIGALISTGTPSQIPLFVVDDESRLRIYVSVPEAYAAEVQQSKTASFTVPDYPSRTFQAALASTAGAIAPASGTLLVQFQVDNATGQLQAGDYAQVTITLPLEDQALSLPSSALMFRDNGMQVATLGPNNRVVIKPITIGRDLGNVVQIATGITKDDKIINNPPDSLAQGDQVNVAPALAAKAR
jgi:multidrug efflux system membrane fusion protein